MTNEEYMRIAIDLAKRGEGLTNPNPMVGCVVVKNNEIIATGYHKAYGEYHAERDALTNCDKDTSGATLYVTLEPCCHTGKTPPCTDIIIEKKISKVVIGSDDPNPLVAGKGIQILRDAGIEVVTHVCKEECDEMNEVFFHYITLKLPYVVMKYAMTLDGHIASASGDSKWVTGETAREHVQTLRRKYASILVGIGTVLADDPMLNYRGEESDIRYQPIRIIVDSHLRIPLGSQIVKTANEYKTIVAYVEDNLTNTSNNQNKKQQKDLEISNIKKISDINNKKEKISALENAGITLWQIRPDASGHVDIVSLLMKMGEEKIDSVLVEGGAQIHGSLLKAGAIDLVYAYIAPKLIGGKDAPSPIAGAGIPLMRDAYQLKDMEIIKLDKDICVKGKLN